MNGSADDTRERLERWIPFVLVVLVMVVAILTISPWPVGAFEDDAIYTVLAKSLATGQGYVLLNLPGTPHGTHYPPGFPFVLSLLWRIRPEFPDNIVVFKFANAVFLSLTALGVYALARTRFALSRWSAAGIALAGTICIVVLLITGMIMSEPLFMAMLFPGLMLAERSADSGRLRDAAAAGLLLGMVALVRTLGAVAIPGAALALLYRRKPKAAITLGVMGFLVVLPWQLWVNAYQGEIPEVLVGKYGAYGPWMAKGYADGGLPFAREVIAINVQRIDTLLGYLFMPVAAAWARTLGTLTVVGLILGGTAAMVKRAPATAGFLLLYLVVVLLWPFEPDRFLIAIWPLLILTGCVGVVSVWRWSAPGHGARAIRLAVVALGVAVGIGSTVYNVRGYRAQWWIGLQRETGVSAKLIVEWVARHTAMTDVLSTEHDLIVYLYTGRQAVPTSTSLASERVRKLSPEEEKAAIRSILVRYQPRYYITGSVFGLRAARELAAETPPLLRAVADTRNALVFKRLY